MATNFRHPLPDGRILRLTIETGNAAFGETAEDRHAEVGRIAGRAIERAERGEESGACMDYNGNTVGSWRVTGRKAVAR